VSYCSECGAEVDGRTKFCRNCGAPIFAKTTGKGTPVAPTAVASRHMALPIETELVPSKAENKLGAPKREAPGKLTGPSKGKVKMARVFGGVVLLIVAVFLFFLIPAVESINSSTTTTQLTTPSIWLGVLEGATNYVGAYPAASSLGYTDANGRPMNVQAYPGQIQIFFDPMLSQEDAEEIVKSNGGDVIGTIPLTGYFLVQVDTGSEASFISSVLSYPQVINAMPNLALEQEQDGVYISEDYLTEPKPVPLNVHGPVAIDSGQHGREVVRTAEANGGTITDIVNITRLQDGRTPGDKWVHALNAIAQGNAIFNPGTTTFINISQGAGYRDDARSGDTNGNSKLGDWSDWTNLPPDLQQESINNRIAFMSNVLQAVQSLPHDLCNDTFITMSGGNNNMPLEPVLSALRANRIWDDLLRDTIAIVTCPSSLYTQANQGPVGDPSIVVMTNPQAANGTSFAAPAANAAIQHLTRGEIINIMNATGTSFAQVVQAAEMAKAANGKVIPSEVQMMVTAVVSAATSPEGTWTGSYSAAHTEPTDRWVRQSGGSLEWSISASNGSFQGSLYLDGIQVVNVDTGEIMWYASCTGTVSGSYSSGSLKGMIDFTVPNTLSPPRSWPFTATLSEDTITGGVSSEKVSWSFTLTRQ